jgi:hypothetical protein
LLSAQGFPGEIDPESRLVNSEVHLVDLRQRWLGQLGARFVVDNVYTRSVCERLQLRISEKRADLASGTDTDLLP